MLYLYTKRQIIHEDEHQYCLCRIPRKLIRIDATLSNLLYHDLQRQNAVSSILCLHLSIIYIYIDIYIYICI